MSWFECLHMIQQAATFPVLFNSSVARQLP